MYECVAKVATHETWECVTNKGRWVVSEYLKALKARQQKKAKQKEVEMSAFVGGHPNFVDFLTISQIGDSARQRGTAKLFFDDGLFKMFLNDHQEGTATCVSARTMEDLMKVADEAIIDPETDWRPSNWAKGKKGKK